MPKSVDIPLSNRKHAFDNIPNNLPLSAIQAAIKAVLDFQIQACAPSHSIGNPLVENNLPACITPSYLGESKEKFAGSFHLRQGSTVIVWLHAKNQCVSRTSNAHRRRLRTGGRHCRGARPEAAQGLVCAVHHAPQGSGERLTRFHTQCVPALTRLSTWVLPATFRKAPFGSTGQGSLPLMENPGSEARHRGLRNNSLQNTCVLYDFIQF